MFNAEGEWKRQPAMPPSHSPVERAPGSTRKRHAGSETPPVRGHGASLWACKQPSSPRLWGPDTGLFPSEEKPRPFVSLWHSLHIIRCFLLCICVFICVCVCVCGKKKYFFSLTRAELLVHVAWGFQKGKNSCIHWDLWVRAQSSCSAPSVWAPCPNRLVSAARGGAVGVSAWAVSAASPRLLPTCLPLAATGVPRMGLWVQRETGTS